MPFEFLEAGTDNPHPSTLEFVLISAEILEVLWIATKSQFLKNDNDISEGNTWKQAVRRKELHYHNCFQGRSFPFKLFSKCLIYQGCSSPSASFVLVLRN